MQAYLLLGGNLGNPLITLQQSHRLIGQKIGAIISQSKFYETVAWGVTDQPNFLNQVICVETTLNPETLLTAIQTIEADLGRKRDTHWGARTMDIDILLYENLIYNKPNLQIPHPLLPQRRFALVPLAELIANYLHPAENLTIQELLALCPDQLSVKVYEIY